MENEKDSFTLVLALLRNNPFMILIQQIGVIILILPGISGTGEQRAHAGCPLESQDHRTNSCPPVPCHSHMCPCYSQAD